MERQLRRLDELEESEQAIPVQKRHHQRANANFEAHRNELIPTLQGQGCPEFYQNNVHTMSSEQNSSGMQVNISGQLVDTTFQPLNISNGPNAS